MNEFEILELLEKTSSSKEKLDILKKNKNSNLIELVSYTFDYRKKFFIKKFDTISKTDRLLDQHNDFLKILDTLNNRDKTGHDALHVVENFFKQLTPQQFKWYERVLKRDLRCGCNVDTFNKVDFNISVFEVELAKDYFDCKKTGELLKKGMTPSPKLDGFRCIAIIENGEVELRSRNGEVYENFPSIIKSLEEKFKDKNLVLDGEIMSDDFNSMQKSAFANKRGTAVGDVFYNIFDKIDLEEWNTDNFKKLHIDRIEELKQLFEDNKFNNLRPIEHLPMVFTEEKVIELRNSLIDQGYEGVILNPNIPYYRGKISNKMLKVKIRKSMDCKVTGFYNGEKGKRFENVLGGFVVLQENGVSCEVGSGLTEEDRTYIWNNQGDFLGKTIEVEYQELSKDEQRMRFPSFIRFRNDK